MKKNWTRRIALILLTLWPMNALAATKNEIVYANLNPDGNVRAVYVVNRFETSAREHIVDYGNYAKIVNLTDLSDIQSASGAQSFDADAGTFYYQGTMEGAQIPWTFTVQYALDGKMIDPGQLGGKSGHVDITFGTRRNTAEDGPYFDNYALSVTATLDSEKCTNIMADGVVIANAGKKKQLSLTILPGSERDYIISLDASDFEMSAFSINAVPLSMAVDDVDTSDIKSDLGDLQDGIGELDSGAIKLKNATQKLKKGANTLYDGSAQVLSGLGSAKSGSAQLASGIDSAAGQISELAGGIAKLKNASGQIASGGEQLAAGAQAIKSGCAKLAENCEALQKNSEGIASAIDSLAGAAASTGSEIALLKKLLSKGQNNADVRQYLSSEMAALQKLIKTMETLDDGLSSLNKNFSSYNAALDQIASAAKELASAAGRLATGVDSYTEPVLELAAATKDFNADQVSWQFAQLDAGMKKLDAGLGTLQTSYAQLHAGIKSLEEGAQKLGGGMRSLEKGTGELKNETGDMGTTVDEKVDETMAKYRGQDFEPVSFADARNEVELVQFVIMTQAIEKPADKQTEETEQDAKAGFWERLKALFRVNAD